MSRRWCFTIFCSSSVALAVIMFAFWYIYIESAFTISIFGNFLASSRESLVFPEAVAPIINSIGLSIGWFGSVSILIKILFKRNDFLLNAYSVDSVYTESSILCKYSVWLYICKIGISIFIFFFSPILFKIFWIISFVIIITLTIILLHFLIKVEA